MRKQSGREGGTDAAYEGARLRSFEIFKFSGTATTPSPFHMCNRFHSDVAKIHSINLLTRWLSITMSTKSECKTCALLFSGPHEQEREVTLAGH